MDFLAERLFLGGKSEVHGPFPLQLNWAPVLSQAEDIIYHMEYQREIGILGLDVTAVFKRKGKRVALKKIKSGKVPIKQNVTKEEIIDYLQNKLKIDVEEPQKKGEGE